jgi:transposase
MLTGFFDFEGVVHHEFLPQGKTVNKEYYLEVMKRLRVAIRKRGPMLGGQTWMLHVDNAPAQTSLLIRQFLAKHETTVIPQPPYSPDQGPANFFLFPPKKCR